MGTPDRADISFATQRSSALFDVWTTPPQHAITTALAMAFKPSSELEAMSALGQRRTIASICISDPAARARPDEEAQFHIAE
jgi:hypothetical protein